MKRDWNTGYNPNREYDEFDITVGKNVNRSESAPIPFLLSLDSPANITGISPILCDVNGRPTGIPVQLSKNWHYKTRSSYAMFFALLPAEAATYRLRLAYGFYGALPSASHAQLSLVGYSDNGGNGRWDQFAIGCWGETICIDSDRSLVDCAITDTRLLMGRRGADGRKWSWTDAGWGGDWLDLRVAERQKLQPSHLKTAYLSHGPCLPHMRQTGFYGQEQEIAVTADVMVARADDYARTFQRLSYEFEKDVRTESVSLFSLGRSHSYHTPRLDVGNGNGLLRSESIPEGLERGERPIEPITLTGPAPHWVSLTGARSTSRRPKPNGYRAFIIREYQARLGGETYSTPTVDTRIHQSEPANADVMLVPPEGVMQFHKGDRVDMLVELITLPRDSEDYYGPNETFREHLRQNPNTWKTVYREAGGNNLAVEVSGGELLQSYPLSIRVQKPEVRWTIQGGVGAIPVRITGVHSPKGFELQKMSDGIAIPFDQSMHGNDYWQVDAEPETDTFAITFNLPSTGGGQTWVFTQTATNNHASTSFVHPGISHRTARIEFVKAKIAAGEQPWASAWKQLQQHRRASLDHQPEPCAHVERGPSNNPNIGSSDFSNDANAAYLHAVQWALSGNVPHAEKAAEILDAWSGTLKSIGNHDARLLVGMEGYEYCNAAELLKHTWDGWPAEKQARFEKMLREIFYPIIQDFYPSANGNWDASMIQTMLAMGVYLDDQAMFDRGKDYFLYGKGNGAVRNYFKPTGQCQESGRDQGHTQMGLDYLACAAEIAWNQGFDLYGAFDNRLLKGFEYTAQYNLGFDVPYEPYRSFEGRYVYERISDDGRGRLRPMYEKVLNHFKQRIGLNAPFTEQAVEKLRNASGDQRSSRRRSSALEILMFAP